MARLVYSFLRILRREWPFVGRANSLVGRMDLAFRVASHRRLLYDEEEGNWMVRLGSILSVDGQCMHATFGKLWAVIFWNDCWKSDVLID